MLYSLKRSGLFRVGMAFLLVGLWVSGSFARSTCDTNADACNAPEVYTITMNNMQVSTSGGSTNAITIVSTPQSFNMASQDAGEVVGNWFSGATLPPGTYNWMKRTIAGTFSFRGYVHFPAGAPTHTYYTASGNDYGTNINRVNYGNFDAANPPADYTTINFNICNFGAPCTAGEMIEEDTSESIPVEFGRATNIKIIFNVNNTLSLVENVANVNYTFFPAEPEVSMEITQN